MRILELESENKMLREQIRVADRAFQHQHERLLMLEAANERANALIAAQAQECDKLVLKIRARLEVTRKTIARLEALQDLRDD